MELEPDPGSFPSVAIRLRPYIAPARQLGQHLLRRHRPRSLSLESGHLLRIGHFLLAPRLTHWLGGYRFGRHLLPRFNRSRVPADMAHQSVRLRPFDKRGMYALRKLAFGELREGTRKGPLFRNLHDGFKTAHAPQHRVDTKSIDEMAGQGKIKHRFCHEGSCYLRSITSRAAPPPPLAYMAVHLQQRQHPGELFMAFTQRSQFFAQNRKQLALEDRLKRLRQVLQECIQNRAAFSMVLIRKHHSIEKRPASEHFRRFLFWFL